MVVFNANPQYSELFDTEFFFTNKEEVAAWLEVHDIFSDTLRRQTKPLLQSRKPQMGKLRSFASSEEAADGKKIETYEVDFDPDVMLMNPRLSVIEEDGAFKIYSLELHDPT